MHKPYIQTHHNITLSDKWHWLRADNWQEVLKNPAALPQDIRQHLEKENQTTAAYLEHTKSLQDELFQELKARLKEDDAGVPFEYGGYAYSWRFKKGADYRTWYRQNLTTSQEEVLLDENELAEGQKYFALGAYEISPNHQYLAYTVDTQGSEFYTLYVKDLTTGQIVEKKKHLSAEVVWGHNSQNLFVVTLTDEHKADAVVCLTKTMEYRLFEEEDKSLFVSLSKTEDGQFILINSHDHGMTEISVISAEAQPEEMKPICIKPRKEKVEYSLSHWEGQFYLHTNEEAVDYQILTAPAKDVLKGEAQWHVTLPHQQGRMIRSMLIQKGYLIVELQEQALPKVWLLNLENDSSAYIQFSAEAYAVDIIPQKDAFSTKLRFQYSTPIQPPQICEQDLLTEERVLLKETEIPCGFNPDDYCLKRIYVSASDGAQIPVTLWYHQNTDAETAPVLEYGYGSYGVIMDAAYRHSAFSLVDRGFVYAIAHIRGGKDCGAQWYEDGKLHHKKNTFTDFISVADFFQNQYQNAKKHQKASILDQVSSEMNEDTSKNSQKTPKNALKRHICAHGGSAGGMLMGVIANHDQAIDLFDAIIAQVPFVDVLNTMLDDTLPLTPPEWPEWGNPLKNKEDFLYIQSYSPYDNIKQKSYPAIFALGGLTDPRVTYWEPAKWVAKLREYKDNSQKPLLLEIDMTSGHGGASGRYEYFKEIARIQAFALSEAFDKVSKI